MWAGRTLGLGPELTRIEQAISRQLLLADQPGFYAEFIDEGLLRGDHEARAAFYASAAQNGWMSRGEIRAKENLPPIIGNDPLTVQSNLVPLAKLGELGGQDAANNPGSVPTIRALPVPKEKP